MSMYDLDDCYFECDYYFEYDYDYPFGIPSDTWTTKGGNKIKLKDMTTQHIKNCMNIVGEDDKWFGTFLKELQARGSEEE